MVVPFGKWLEEYESVPASMSKCEHQQSLVFRRTKSGKAIQEVMEESMYQHTCIYLPNREELSFRVVFAFPKASRIGLVARICCSISLESCKENFSLVLVVESGGFTEARYCIMNFAYSGTCRDTQGMTMRDSYRFRFTSSTKSVR